MSEGEDGGAKATELGYISRSGAARSELGGFEPCEDPYALMHQSMHAVGESVFASLPSIDLRKG